MSLIFEDLKELKKLSKEELLNVVLNQKEEIKLLEHRMRGLQHSYEGLNKMEERWRRQLIANGIYPKWLDF